ncbi:MAG TPA: glycoside hydrolase family 3 N-terminal domain-containing protein [Chitinophagaceae bacterium]|nr:glycoside hydrolase family 3 N-terminal domain-containing protein [Chitinophagaceae bacterium]
MRKLVAAACFLAIFMPGAMAQYRSQLPAAAWVDSVFNSLTEDQKIAQLMVIRAHSNLGADHIAKVTNDIKQYNVGALCFFQGGPVRQAKLTNFYQSIAQTPLMVTIDGEWGLGMRLDSVTRFPYQLTLGALDDEELVYKMGVAVGEQCKRLGVHVNYAPVVDINNNPKNPVIGYRSFGEDVDKVSKYGVAYTKGMQDAGIMACAKHFPGHGDVDVDSHYDLPVVNKSIAQLNALELVPFRALAQAGVGSMMIAHLAIPSVDNTKNKATSISKPAVTGLLRDSLGYDGLTFTDALEMQGVAKYFPGGTIAVEALIAGNDMLCLPASVPETIAAVKKAIAENKLSWNDINEKVKKVLASKYQLGLYQWQPIELRNLTEELNAKTDAIRYEVAAKSITLISQASAKASRTDYADIPVLPGEKKKVAYVGIGISALNDFGRRIKETYKADVFLFSYKDTKAAADKIMAAVGKEKYDAVIVGVHNYSLRPANNYGISTAAIDLWKRLNFIKTVTFVFGNVLAAENFCGAYTLVATHQDDNITQQAAADLLEGRLVSKGRLPVSVCNYKYGHGIVHAGPKRSSAALTQEEKWLVIDSIAKEGIAVRAYPGCVVLVAHKGEIVYHKAFGHHTYDSASPAMTTGSIFDVASITKTAATTVSIMKLVEEKKVDLDKYLGNYLPFVRGTNKANLKVEDILLHEARLVSFISFYRETIDPETGMPNPDIYSDTRSSKYSVRVAENLYLRNDWRDTLIRRILDSPLGAKNRYVYSDNDFIFLGKIVEQVSGMPLDQYVNKNFYSKLGMVHTGFTPRSRFSLDQIVPTESEQHFRRQLIQGDVHDEGASMFGGVAGHAGLFSTAYDLATLYQVLLNGGTLNGQRIFNPSTVKLFTSYRSKISRRALGFDKPEKDNATRREPYPSLSVSPETFGHTGFTGTCIWADPKHDLIYVFLSNRVYPTREGNRLGQYNIRPRIQEAIYRALGI